jgi:hypothetical protein
MAVLAVAAVVFRVAVPVAMEIRLTLLPLKEIMVEVGTVVVPHMVLAVAAEPLLSAIMDLQVLAEMGATVPHLLFPALP